MKAKARDREKKTYDERKDRSDSGSEIGIGIGITRGAISRPIIHHGTIPREEELSIVAAPAACMGSVKNVEPFPPLSPP